MKKITIKDLIGMSTLTLGQSIKYLEHPNYQLKDAPMVIMNNETIDYLISGTLNAISEDGEISFTADGECIIQKIQLDMKTILIVYPPKTSPQAIFV